MQEILALSLQAMRDDMLRLDHVGNNLANALTPGYKREVAVGQSAAAGGQPFAAVVDSLQARSGAASAFGGTGFPAGLPSTLFVQADVQPGTLKSTGESMDVALAGPGYFEVLTDTGPAYTRQGNFRVDARGRLVTAKGQPVMGVGGEILLNNMASPVIDGAGKVYESQASASRATSASGGRLAPGQSQAAQPLAQLKVVQLDDAKSLQRLGDGLVSAGSTAPSQMKDADVQVRQGYLENSNVNPMQEMVQLIQTMRHFESVQKALMGYDDMTGEAVRKLGDMS